MLKVAGWIIPRASVDVWRQFHPQLEQTHIAYSTRGRVRSMLKEREVVNLPPLPILEMQLKFVQWPKTTKEAQGRDVCILIQQVRIVNDETLDNFTPIPLNIAEDQEVFEALESDGLKLGEWITIPDPFEEEWPFDRRYPGAIYPPEIDNLGDWKHTLVC